MEEPRFRIRARPTLTLSINPQDQLELKGWGNRFYFWLERDEKPH
jgi:hypothetical protein